MLGGDLFEPSATVVGERRVGAAPIFGGSLSSQVGGALEPFHGSDEEIAANLRVLHDDTARGGFIVGSLFRDEPVSWVLKGMGDKSFTPRRLEQFGELVRDAGWLIERRIDDNPVYHVVALSKR